MPAESSTRRPAKSVIPWIGSTPHGASTPHRASTLPLCSPPSLHSSPLWIATIISSVFKHSAVFCCGSKQSFHQYLNIQPFLLWIETIISSVSKLSVCLLLWIATIISSVSKLSVNSHFSKLASLHKNKNCPVFLQKHHRMRKQKHHRISQNDVLS